MIPKLKLIGTTLLILAYLMGYCQKDTLKNVDSIATVENQTRKVTEWKDQVPTITGWRTVRPGMTIEELKSVMPGEDFRTKKVKYRNVTTGQEARLKKNVMIDGLDYKVSFIFDSSGHLTTISFRCDNKVKKETTSNVVASFTGLLGESTNKENNSFGNVPYRKDFETYTWKQANSTLNVLSVTLRSSHSIVTGRFIIVSMHYE